MKTRLRVLVALDTSPTGESAARAMADWARTVPLGIHLISVIHPNEIAERDEKTFTGEFYLADETEPGYISQLAMNQFGAPGGTVGDPAPRVV